MRSDVRGPDMITAEAGHPRRCALAMLGLGLWATTERLRAQSRDATATAGLPAMSARDTPVGGIAPEFDLPLWDHAANGPHASRRVALADLRGRWLYLDFWASWCGPCRLSFPWMNELAQRLAPVGLSVVAIGLDTRADAMARFLAPLAPRFTVLWDARQITPARYQVQAMPSSFVIDPQGRIVAMHRGFTLAEAPTIERDLRQRMGAA